VYAGVDIGGTKTDVVLTDLDGVIAHRHRVASGQGNDEVIAAAVAAMNAVCQQAGIGVADVATIGVGVPGAVIDGVVSHAYNLGIERLDVASRLAEAWGKTPLVDNDVNNAALGAWVLGGHGARSMAFLNLGTGLAAGIVLDGKVWRGRRGAAGEIGHISIDPAGPIDSDGTAGAIETYASGSGIVRQWGASGMTAQEILSAATSGDPAAEVIRDRLFFGVASAVRVLVLTLDVDEVVIGGGLTGWGSPLMAGTIGLLDDWQERSAFLRSLELSERVRVLDTDQPVAAIGAAMMGAGRG